MAKQVAIVESPAKAKTIAKFLGSDFVVESSYGHIRDLPRKKIGVEVEKDFEPVYITPPDKKKVIKKLKEVIKSADKVWLATDEDREGEAIAWHLAKSLGLDEKETSRIVFHEITESALKKALANPRPIDRPRVDAQQARRVLDRLVGYELSPVLWRKIRVGLSAGRVQSVAVRLIVEREREIRAHKPVINFKIIATFETDGSKSFEAEYDQKIATEQAAKKFLEGSAEQSYQVNGVESRTTKRNPPAPFTTSSLQQTASSQLGFSVSRTMLLAQRLYEAGHISYMRTDSNILSSQAMDQAATYIKKEYGDKYYEQRQYKTSSQSAQEAHEAIRPTDFNNEEAGEDKAQQKLYDLIRRRTLATQMTAAQLDKTTITVNAHPSGAFKARGEVLAFPGFMKIYQDKASQDKELPAVKEGQSLKLKDLTATETPSKPKARYTEASLVRKLEQLGIGRPSTYAPTISTIQKRGYVEKTSADGQPHKITILQLVDKQVKSKQEEIRLGSASNKLLPTEIGEVVNDFLVKYFTNVLDYKFTAKVESQFDDIAQDKLKWQAMIKDFYKPFHEDVTKVQDISRQEASQMRELGTDPKSGKPVFARVARYGPIIQIGKTEDEEKPRFVPIPKNVRFDEITFEQAQELMTLPRKVGKTEEGEDIHATIGPFGPYVKAGSTSASLKEHDPLTVKEADAREVIKAKREQDANKEIQNFKEAKIQVLNGPYGAYVTDGKNRRTVPKDQDPAKISLDEAKAILATPVKRRRYR